MCRVYSCTEMSHTLFVDELVSTISIKPDRQRIERSVNVSSTQTQPLQVKEADCQARDIGNVATQTKRRGDEEERGKTVETDPKRLAEFLAKVEPTVVRALKQNMRTKTLGVDLQFDSDQTLLNTHSLRHEPVPEDMQCLAVTWNASGTTIAVAYGTSVHEDWCAHHGYVCTWNIERRALIPGKADLALEFECCVTTLCYHTNNPAVLATGTFRGEVTVWNLSQDEGSMLVASSEVTGTAGSSTFDGKATVTNTTVNGHSEPVSSLVWIKSDSEQMQLVSSGLDGKIFVWTIPARGTQLQVSKAFVVVTGSLPRALRGNASAVDKETGVTCCAFNRGDGDRFMIATETGGVFQCSMNSREAVAGYVGVSDVPVFSPIALPLKPHKGPVYVLDPSPFASHLFLSASADGSLRCYHFLKTEPQLTLELGLGYVHAARWSPVRPAVFVCCTSQGRLAVFDVTRSETQPIVWTDVISDGSTVSLLSLAFNHTRHELVATGDAKGVAKVWSLGDRFSSQLPNEERVLQEISGR